MARRASSWIRAVSRRSAGGRRPVLKRAFPRSIDGLRRCKQANPQPRNARDRIVTCRRMSCMNAILKPFSIPSRPDQITCPLLIHPPRPYSASSSDRYSGWTSTSSSRFHPSPCGRAYSRFGQIARTRGAAYVRGGFASLYLLGAAFPAVLMIIQILPLPFLANPVWTSVSPGFRKPDYRKHQCRRRGNGDRSCELFLGCRCLSLTAAVAINRNWAESH